jgi:hypothetical protein
MAGAVRTPALHVIAANGATSEELDNLQGMWTSKQYLRLTQGSNWRLEFADSKLDVLCVAPDNGCTCRQWSLADVDLAHERALQAIQQHNHAEYCLLIEEWNSRGASAPDGSTFDFRAFYDYLMSAYDGMEMDAMERSAS